LAARSVEEILLNILGDHAPLGSGSAAQIRQQITCSCPEIDDGGPPPNLQP
jgi:hypothetical protein